MVNACVPGVPEDADGDSTSDRAVIGGELEIFVATYDDGHTETQYGLRLDNGERIALQFDTDPGPMQPDEYMEFTGRWSLDKTVSTTRTFTVAGVTKHLGVDHSAVGGDEGGSISVGAAAGGKRSPMEHRVAVLVLGDVSYTLEEMRAQVNPTAGSAASYLGENSLGVDTFEGDVFGPYDVNTANCGDRFREIADLARAAAEDDGVDLDRYNKLAFVIPGGCGWGGLGQVGSPGRTRQLLTWYNNWFDCLVVSHELGHNLGLNHSHNTDCEQDIYRANRSGCDDTEYGHVFDVMGGGGCGDGHFSAAQKQYMGWLDDCEDVTAGSGAVFNLSPMDGDCGVRSLRIPIRGENSYYYLEYRKTGAGEFAGARGQDRVVLSVSNDGATVRPDVYLLDSTPESASGNRDFRDGWLAVGKDYNLPGNVRVRVLDLGDVARVEVTAPNTGSHQCHSGARPPTLEDGSVGRGCGDGCPDDPNKTNPGFCGCGVPDDDTDGDSIRDCEDGCPDDPNKGDSGVCGCGVLELECATLAPGLKRAHYSGTWSTLPNFQELTPTAVEIAPEINVDDFAGTESFGVVFTGGLRIDTAGTYDFELGSDDGSRLSIGVREVVDNDGLHGFRTRTGRVQLSKGVHAIRVEFFERGGGERLRLRYRRGSAAYQEVPANVLVHPTESVDNCPDDPNKTAPGTCGCGVSDADGDGDGVADCNDDCPADAVKTAPGTCGCGTADTDADSDGTPDCRDDCPADASKTAPGLCGCGSSDGDTDRDGTADCQDGCPSDAAKQQPGVCGCGVTDADSDGDGTANCNDGCPNDGTKLQPGACGCGVPEGSCDGQPSPGLQRAHYSGEWRVLPDFDALTPNSLDVASQVDVQDFSGTDRFGVVFTGLLRIDAEGTYDFELGSDDGSLLQLDGSDVVVNDGLHGFATRTGSVELAQGFHSLRVEFFERTGGERLRLRYRPAGGTFVTVPASVLFHGEVADDGGDPGGDDPGDGEPTCAQVDEGGTAQLACPQGQTIASVAFASYGTPTGSCGVFETSTCDATTSVARVEDICVGRASCSVPANNGQFGDPCPGTRKRLVVEFVCSGAVDECPEDPNKETPGVCGCGTADTDADGDGAADCQDECPADADKLEAGLCGCGMPDADSDGDGAADCQDECPADASKLEAGLCGCGIAEGTCAPPTFSASGENLPREGMDKAFDGQTSTKWLTFADAGWIQVTHAVPVIFDSYTIASANDHPERDPHEWQLLASNDGQTWQVLDTRAGQTFSARFQSRTFSFDNSAPYVMYRLNILTNLDPPRANSTQLSELTLQRSSATPPPASPTDGQD